MRNIEKGLVYTNDQCIGCNKCIRTCSCIGACVSTEPDENGNSRIMVNGSLCVSCGACFDICEHNARDFIDDTERFFDVLKLDKSFIDGHTGTKRDSVVVSNVAKMASELDMSVITEGVEKEEQVEFLKSVNIDLVQGYLFDKPLPKAAFEQRLKKKVYD